MGDRIIMSRKESERKTILEGVIFGKYNLKQAAQLMKVCYRQAKRLMKRHKADPICGLIHKSRGKAPSNAISIEIKEKILTFYRKKYMDFGPIFAAEKLLEDDSQLVNPETLRIWLKKEGLWHRKRKHKLYRERRERRPSFGDLLQIDGSIHCWFDGIPEHQCLLNMVDDATGITLAELDTGETTQVLLSVLKRWVEMYGIPTAVYVDLKSVYVSAKYWKKKFDGDFMQEEFSVFQQVCQKLNIEVIRAYSPQAKGRVERKHRVFQDRFVKDLKLYNIRTIEQANDYLQTKFLNKINEKFSQDPSGGTDSHRDPSPYGDLNQIFCWNYPRKLKNDWTVQFENDYYQIRNRDIKPGAWITIRKYLDGSQCFWFEDIELSYGKLERKPEPPSRNKRYRLLKGPASPALLSEIARRNKHKSPWSRSNSNWLKKPTIHTNMQIK